jgi:choline dehydrogenase
MVNDDNDQKPKNNGPTDLSGGSPSELNDKKVNRREFIKDSVKIGASAAFVASGCSTLSSSFREITSSSKDTYEYIVVGTGAGGGPVACNLARAGFRVLLLEAGGDCTNTRYKVPALHPQATEDPEMSWSFFVKHYSDPIRQAQDSKFDKEMGGVFYPRTASVGGCTAHNAMVTLYPENEDWDNIGSLTGDSSWNGSDMRSLWQRMEQNHYAKPDATNSARRGYNGWLSTEQAPLKLLAEDAQLAQIVGAAFAGGGTATDTMKQFVANDESLYLDPNDWNYVQNKTNGVFRVPQTTRNGSRAGTRDFIMDTLDRFPQNLSLRTYALATRVLFNENRKNEAIGIEYLEGKHLYAADPSTFGKPRETTGVRRQVFATREVILAGGAFNSPQLLMLSGIGDPDQLEKNHIPTRVALPGVGKNLQDRYEISVVTELPRNLDILSDCTFNKGNDPCMPVYESNPTAHIYGTNGVVAAVIEKSGPDQPTPDLVIFATAGRFRGYFRGWSEDVVKNKNEFTWAILKGHTHNTAGTVQLRSSSPLDTPDINFRSFDDGNDLANQDLEAILTGMKRARKINSRLILDSHREEYPGPDLKSDDELRQYIKQESWGHHASCSNKMGPATDPTSVVDSKFRVHGTERLRVVDASVFPKIPGLFIVVPVYMIAEKASDDIIADAKT